MKARCIVWIVMGSLLGVSPPARGAATYATPTATTGQKQQAPRFPPELSELIKLAQAGVDESVLIAFVQNSPVPYSLTAEGILKLREAGISDRVIAAILQRGGELRRNAAALMQAQAAANAAASEEGSQTAPTYPDASYPVSSYSDPGYSYYYYYYNYPSYSYYPAFYPYYSFFPKFHGHLSFPKFHGHSSFSPWQPWRPFHPWTPWTSFRPWFHQHGDFRNFKNFTHSPVHAGHLKGFNQAHAGHHGNVHTRGNVHFNHGGNKFNNNVHHTFRSGNFPIRTGFNHNRVHSTPIRSTHVARPGVGAPAPRFNQAGFARGNFNGARIQGVRSVGPMRSGAMMRPGGGGMRFGGMARSGGMSGGMRR